MNAKSANVETIAQRYISASAGIAALALVKKLTLDQACYLSVLTSDNAAAERAISRGRAALVSFGDAGFDFAANHATNELLADIASGAVAKQAASAKAKESPRYFAPSHRWVGMFNREAKKQESKLCLRKAGGKTDPHYCIAPYSATEAKEPTMTASEAIARIRRAAGFDDSNNAALVAMLEPILSSLVKPVPAVKTTRKPVRKTA